MYKKIVLNNGLTIILADMPGMESLSIGIWIAAGGRYEKKEKAGVSHFLEHMLFKGTKTRSARDLKEAVEGKGGLLNAFTSEEFTCYLAKVLSKDSPVAIDVLTDMIANPKLAIGDFNKEKSVVLEEIKMYIDMPHHYVHELLAELLWPNQPLGVPLSGTPKTVSALTREDLAVYKRAFYNPKNIVISIAGKLPAFDLVKNISARLSKIEGEAKNVYTPAKLGQKEPQTHFYFKNTEQTHIAMGFHSCSRFSEDKYNLDLLNIILGGNMSSRLFNEVRENLGLAYEISSSVKHYDDTGALVVSAGIDTKKVIRAIKVIVGVLRGMKAKKVTKEEFSRAKEFYRGQLLMIFEETMNHMLWVGEKFTCGDLEYKAADVLRRLDKVTIEEIQKTGREILKSDNLSLAIVGPTAKKSESEIRKGLCDL